LKREENDPVAVENPFAAPKEVVGETEAMVDKPSEDPFD